jgi:hypothetical protein
MRSAECGIWKDNKDLTECGMRIADSGIKNEKRDFNFFVNSELRIPKSEMVFTPLEIFLY